MELRSAWNWGLSEKWFDLIVSQWSTQPTTPPSRKYFLIQYLIFAKMILHVWYRYNFLISQKNDLRDLPRAAFHLWQLAAQATKTLVQSQSPHPHYLSPPTPNSHYLNPLPPPLSLASCRKANNLLEYNDLCRKGWLAIAKLKPLGCLSTTSLPILPIKGVLTQSDKIFSGSDLGYPLYKLWVQRVLFQAWYA